MCLWKSVKSQVGHHTHLAAVLFKHTTPQLNVFVDIDYIITHKCCVMLFLKNKKLQYPRSSLGFYSLPLAISTSALAILQDIVGDKLNCIRERSYCESSYYE